MSRQDYYAPEVVASTQVIEAYAVPIEEEQEIETQRTPQYVPSRLPSSIPLAALNQSSINIPAIREFLTASKWTTGLQDTFIRNLSKVPIRFFICDDSGSMNTDDGHRLFVNRQGVTKFINCTRWSELSAALSFHAHLARAANATTQFRFLNASSPITIGSDNNEEASSNDFRRLLELLQQSPSGKTPLCVHIREVIRQIEAIAEELRRNGQKACVMIATDGESTDGDVAQALKPLEHLPAWVVIRLCTDEERIVKYWNNIDNDLELEIDVLDDLEGEAEEIAAVNGWLTYGEPVHRLREFGIPIKEIDLLDEQPLNLDQVRLFCSLLFGGSLTEYPHPAEDWSSFAAAVSEKQKAVGMTWNPLLKRNTDWIDLSKIQSSNKGVECILL